MGLVTDDLKQELDQRFDLATTLHHCLSQALKAYTDPAEDRPPKMNIPMCSREHLTYIVKELKEYCDEVHHVRCELPRLLLNKRDDD